MMHVDEGRYLSLHPIGRRRGRPWKEGGRTGWRKGAWDGGADVGREGGMRVSRRGCVAPGGREGGREGGRDLVESYFRRRVREIR